MPELHELPDLVDPSDFDLSPAQQRWLWVRDHAFIFALAATLVVAAVLTVRVVDLEAQHRAAVLPETYAAPASAPDARTPRGTDTEMVLTVATDAPADSPTESLADASGEVDEGVLGAVQEPKAPPARTHLGPDPVPLFSRLLASAVDEPASVVARPAPTSTSRRETRSAARSRATSYRRAQPDRAVLADAVSPRSVARETPAAQTDLTTANSGTLTVQVLPWGSVFINDRLVQREVSARFQTRLQAGSYPVKVVHPVLGTWRGMARVQPGKEVAVLVNFNK